MVDAGIGPTDLTIFGLMIAHLFSCVDMDATRSGTAAAKDYCEGETFKARCSYDEVVMMDRASYGRMLLDRCVKVNMGYIGCQADVLDIADEKCSGRRSCDISIPDVDFETKRPCLELKSYFQVAYHCAKVATVDSTDCRPGKYLRANTPHPPTPGNLASILAMETRCGSEEKPWIIEVSHGQRINLTIVDFTTRRSLRPSGVGATTGTACVRYATVLERRMEGDESFVICGRQGRERHVYTSRSHVIRILMDVHGANPDYFLISYQAIGCPDPVRSSDHWFRRIDEDLLIGCKDSPDRWRLTCNHDNQWVGESAINCTSMNIARSEVVHVSLAEKNPNAVLVAVLCVMVVLVVLLITLIALLLYKRYRRRQRSPFSVDHRPKDSTKTTDGSSATYTDGTESATTPSSSRKNQRYGRHSNQTRRHQHRHVYDSPITEPQLSRNRDRASEYERVETCQTIAQFAHIWNTPLPKIPGQ